MQLIINPPKTNWKEIIARPYADNTTILDKARVIIQKVKEEGDAALHHYNEVFDGLKQIPLEVSPAELESAVQLVPAVLKQAILQARQNIEKFHRHQLHEENVDTMDGVMCSRKNRPIEKVGLYIPGGTAPLFSTVLMLGIPAQLAGCKEIILCTPPGKNGQVHPAILFAAQAVGVTRIFKSGGAQAIAAMAYGTETIPRVYKIFGPGNQYVTAAKQLVQVEGVAIDMPAGPSELCVLADETAHVEFVASDLLSQAEHGADSQVLLVTTSKIFAENVKAAVDVQLSQLPRKEIAAQALQHSRIIIVKDVEEAVELVNEYAPEHLIINCRNEDEIAGQVISAGSVFIGAWSPESAGDYASGTNHTLPTNGFARAYSGVSVDSFVKKITYQKLNEKGLQGLAPSIITMAEAEGLQAHANAVSIRVKSMVAPLEKAAHGFDLSRLVRENIKRLKPYSSARSEYSGQGQVFLDANENSFGSPLTKWYNRYPDPLQMELKKKISAVKKSEPSNILLGNGSDECIDLLIRAFCEPGKDQVIICPPTYGMYEVCAGINNVETVEVPLTPVFQLDMDALEAAISERTKMIFICSPNNPTGNSILSEDIEMILNNFEGLVVLDEAYINYSRQRSFLSELKDYPNLVILQTFSKAWGLAALRLGMCFASAEIIEVLNRIKPPYNINQATQELALKALENLDDVNSMIRETVKERQQLEEQLKDIPFVQKIFISDANFLLVKMDSATGVYQYLKTKGIIVRNRSNIILCDDCLRITIGTPAQNQQLINTLKTFN